MSKHQYFWEVVVSVVVKKELTCETCVCLNVYRDTDV